MSQIEVKLEKQSGKAQPLYEQIRRQIRLSIESQKLLPGQRLPTVASLVKQWDVDYGTVKSAFDLLESDGLLKVEPRKGAVILDQVPTKQYTMMFIRWGTDAFIVDIAEGIDNYCHETNQKTMCVDARLDHNLYLDAITHPPHEVDGIIILPLDTPHYRAAIQQTIQQGINVVFVDRVLPGLNTSSVTADHFAAGYRATRHMLETLGLPVYYLGFIKSPSSSHDLYHGWMEAMRENSYLNLNEFVVEMDVSEADPITYHDIYAIPKKLALDFFKTRRKGPYSILATNDYVAYAIYQAAEEMGLRIGKDVFVMGFGDLPFCAMTEPAMSSVYQPRKQLGFEAAKILHQELTGQIRRPIHRVLPLEMRIRASTSKS